MPASVFVNHVLTTHTLPRFNPNDVGAGPKVVELRRGSWPLEQARHLTHTLR